MILLASTVQVPTDVNRVPSSVNSKIYTQPSERDLEKAIPVAAGELVAVDVIWAQCVRCTDFTPEVPTKILEAAGRGVHFQMVINKHSLRIPVKTITFSGPWRSQNPAMAITKNR